RSLRGQPVEKLDQFIFQMRNRIVRRCTIQIVYMPVFDTFTPLGESGGDERAMLGLFHSYNMICRRQVGLRQGNWKALILLVRYSFLLQTCNRVTRNWSIVATI